ncbi:hypothetical protein FKW77_007124 [Venturia effusa]|uniref:Uncharacterized protein n=1 Tax=Venturia effusa TaxID=50376 RepID=A0A517LCK9_9PEZI|nr:hypothetical protein FKW77_007124 [Venturia effusa]
MELYGLWQLLLKDRACTDYVISDNLGRDNDGTLSPCGNNVFACNPDAKSGLANCAAGKGVFSLAQGSLQTVVGQSTLRSTATPSVPVSSATTATSHTASSASSSPVSTHTVAPAPGSKAGIIAGSTVAVIAVLGFILWLLRFLRKRYRNEDPDSHETWIHMNSSVRRRHMNGNGDVNTFASETSIQAPFPHPYSPPVSPAPPINRGYPHVFGSLGVWEDDPYKPAYSPPPRPFSVPREEVGELGG